MGIFDGLQNPAAPAFAFQQGLAHGKAEREDREVRGALSAYAVNPDDEDAFQRLAQWRPELAIQIGQDRREREHAAQVGDLQRAAASGDRNALAELAGIDLDAYDKLADNDRQKIKEVSDYIGNAALAVSRLPPEQRPAAWDHYIDQGVAAGHANLAEYKGQYSEEALNGALAQAGMVKQFIDMNEPRYQAIPEGGTLVNTSDPAAVQQYMGGQGGAPAGGPPPEAVAALQRGEGTPEQFDEMFGAGASQRFVGNGGGAASRVTGGFLSGF